MTSDTFIPPEAPTTPLGEASGRANAPQHAAGLDVRIGSVIAGRYRLTAPIGEGATGRVYQAIDEERDTGNGDPNIIALKLLTQPWDETAGHFASLKSQFGRWRRLLHPHIVRLFDCDRAGSAVFITMEYIAGESVYVKLRRGGPSPTGSSIEPGLARRIIASVAEALAYAHHQGVVHGDLKPGNIIVSEDADAKVVDFGMLRWLSRPGVTEAAEAFESTPRYASPEVKAGEKPRPCDDVFSLACVAYEMLTGFHPFDGVPDVRAPHALPWRRGITAVEHAAVARALRTQPDERTATIPEFMAEFSRTPRRSFALWPVWSGAVAIAAVSWFLYRPSAHSPPVVPPRAAAPTVSADQAVRESPPRAPGSLIQDCAACPSMTVLAPGQFEQGADIDDTSALPLEKPRHPVRIGYAIAVSTTDITVADFRQFAATVVRDMKGCDIYGGAWRHRPAAGWEDPGFPQTDSHPVTCVSWNDAVAYAEWLSRRTGHRYRLPSASEWEYAARAGAGPARPWGGDANAACASANIADRSAERRFPGWTVFPCDDGYVYTAPAGSFSPNAFGLRDMLGNVLVWTEDCWQPDYMASPVDGSARVAVDCRDHEVRGASWFTSPAAVTASYRNHFPTDHRASSVGFRLVRDMQ